MTKARTLADNYAADISGITAGTGITGGGTSGTVTITNEMATTIDAKGDLVIGTGADTFGRLAVASTAGYVLTVDSAEATGLKWAIAAGGDTFAAGKNKIINGDFNINQRGFSSTTSSGTYGFDRWVINNSGGTVTYSAETFTPGTAPVSGYEAKNYARVVTTGQSAAGDYAFLRQFIESVRTFAGQTITVSFWAKASTGTPNISVEAVQNFGTGGSPSANVTGSVAAGTTEKIAITSSWARYSATLTIPSISGKTIGTTTDGSLAIILWTSAGSTFDTRTDTLGTQSVTIDFWGVQAEAGSTATDFQTATGTLAGELAACQRYYYRWKADSVGSNIGVGYIGGGLGDANLLIQFPAEMRTKPTALEQSGTASDYSILNSSGATVLNAVPTFTTSTTLTSRIQFQTAGSFTASSCAIGRAASASAYLGWSAEL